MCSQPLEAESKARLKPAAWGGCYTTSGNLMELISSPCTLCNIQAQGYGGPIHVSKLCKTQNFQICNSIRNLLRKMSTAAGNLLFVPKSSLPGQKLLWRSSCFTRGYCVFALSLYRKQTLGSNSEVRQAVHRLYAGGQVGWFKWFFFTRTSGQSSDLFPYLLNCVHNCPLMLEVSWLSYCKGVLKALPVIMKVGKGTVQNQAPPS